MQAYVQIGASREVTLQRAILIYGNGRSVFATLHEVRCSGEAPYLAPGEALTTAFLRSLAEGLGSRVRLEILPENVLARTPETIVWWSRARHRLMFFGGSEATAQELNGRMYPHPALVFRVTGAELFVRALGSNTRPTADTRLKTAPYYNTDSHGRVCLGSMRVPEDTSVEAISEWESSYFSSAFTHPSGAVRLTSHPGGFVRLWRELAASRGRFPVRFLTDARQTLRQFVEGE
jgi:PRTRC genetic system protein B